jgi:hypothetical protein
MRRGNTRSYPAFPEIEAQLGYNPARFLVPTNDEMDELSWSTRAKAFIHGMDEVATVRAWIAVERALELGDDGPRSQVITWLEDRQAVLDGTADQETADQTETRTQPSPAAMAESPDETSTETDDVVAQTASDTTNADAGLAADGGTTPDPTPTCSDCQADLTREEIAGKTGFWYPQCQEFRKPATAEVPA